MSPALTLYWRGPLDACNFACSYCPFAKRAPRPEVLAADRAALERFVGWVEAQRGRTFAILFTPWGEAMVWPWYQRALAQLSRVEHVLRVGAQSNGSGGLAWLADARASRIAMWLTWHPDEVPLARFRRRVEALVAGGARVSAGLVARVGRLGDAEALAAALPAGVSLWINAERPGPPHPPAELARLEALDPVFRLDHDGARSRGRACAAGESSLLVAGDGEVRRCHPIARPLGNLYDDGLDALLARRPCPRSRCECYVGYSHLEHVGLAGRHGLDALTRYLNPISKG